MKCVATLASAVVLLAGSGLVASCRGGPPGAGQDEEPAASGACTGAIPANATACPGAEVGLTSNAPRTVSAACTGVPCLFACAPGFVVAGSACALAPIAAREIRLTDNGDGTVTVTDALGATTWLRDAGCTDLAGGVMPDGSALTWSQARAWAGGLASGTCGLRDGSSAGDWRLPADLELVHLSADLASGDPFVHVEAGRYWTSWMGDTGGDYMSERARAVDVLTGGCFDFPQESPFHVWPVRVAAPPPG